MEQSSDSFSLAQLLESISGWLWEIPLLYLLIGGGLYFTIYSRFTPFLYLWHGIQILRGKYNNPNDPGEINHFQALCSALSGTVGMGNITGVAVAVIQGGPGALFWMWVCALVGMATKFFTCSLAIMYRGRDHTGRVQGGPMYFIVEGLGTKWKPLAMAFVSSDYSAVYQCFNPINLLPLSAKCSSNRTSGSSTLAIMSPRLAKDCSEYCWQF